MNIEHLHFLGNSLFLGSCVFVKFIYRFFLSSFRVVCKCGFCGSEKQALSEWEQHTGSKIKNWRISIRVKDSMLLLEQWVCTKSFELLFLSCGYLFLLQVWFCTKSLELLSLSCGYFLFLLHVWVCTKSSEHLSVSGEYFLFRLQVCVSWWLHGAVPLKLYYLLLERKIMKLSFLQSFSIRTLELLLDFADDAVSRVPCACLIY